jgi:hypothetical protein
VDNNIYFQQIKNSATDIKYYELSIAFSTLKTVLEYYFKIHLLTEELKDRLLEKISLTKDIDTCCFFFYMGEVIE